MRWYEGDIAQAVVTSKSRNAIFVVYVEGKDEKSTNLTSHINHTDVSSKLESDNFVALKVEAGSVPHTQFAAIYSNVQVPSIFFIGKSGQPIDIITESSSSSDLSARINSVIQTHTGVAVPAPAAAENTAATHSESFIQSEKQPEEAAKSDKEAETVCENGVCAKPASKPEESPKADSNAAFLEQEKQELSKEDKVERAKQLVDEKREAKRQQEEEDAKKKELERRKLGQEVQKMQRSQQDQELKNLMEERQRAKNEEKAARDRILAQIAQDKADRASRFAPAVASSPQPPPAAADRPIASNSNVARLQFRLPDGASQTQEFEASATLSTVRDFISGNLRLPFRTYSLSTTFPRREFTAEDSLSSLRDLQLCPNAVIMILPAHTGGTVSSAAADGGGSGFLSILWLLVAPIVNIFGYFRALIFGQPDAGATTPPVQPADQNKRTGASDEPETTEPQSPAAKRKAMETTVVRRQGNSNIHRLSDRTESDDDNNTWNGNSTQQM